METADFTESILNEVFRELDLASISSHLLVFLENYVTDFLSYALLKFLTSLLKNTCWGDLLF